MKLFDMAAKDLLRAARSVSFWAFALVVPLMVSGIFYLAFSGAGGDDGGFDVPITKVQLVNLDAPEEAGAFSAGQMLVEFLKAEELETLVQVTEAADAAAARASVDRQEAGVAVIIPAGFTDAVVTPGRRAEVEVYRDPTLILGPSIVQGIIRRFVDGFSGSKIAAAVAYEQLAERGVQLDAGTAQTIAMQYGQWAGSLGANGSGTLVETRSPTGPESEAPDIRTSVIALIMAGMMVFYVFFTGAASAQTILEEERAGTLPRLFTTPTSHAAILGAKILAALVTLILQTVVLVVLSALLFGVDWGPPLPVALATTALVLVAASFGLLITLLLKNVQQTGIIYGGVLTVAGMVGMLRIFTANVPGAARETYGAISLLVPQGWAVRAWELLLGGGGVPELLPAVLVLLSLAAVFFVLAVLRFRKRFA